MSLPRIFVASQLKFKQELVLEPSASQHILQVLRLRINDPLLVFNNTGGEFQAVLTSINKHHAVITIGEFVARHSESPLSIHLGQGISRGEKMDFTIQKAVELGVNIITPLFTEYCNVKLKNERLGNRLTHWQSVAVSAAEQSERCYVPKILPAENLATWCVATANPSLRLLFDPKATHKLNDIHERPSNIAILVGPEGGLSDQEIILAKQNHFLPITLGPRILRTETAALTAISILQAKWGDL